MNAISLAQHSTAGVCPCLPRQSISVNTILTVAMTAAVPVVFVSVWRPVSASPGITSEMFPQATSGLLTPVSATRTPRIAQGVKLIEQRHCQYRRASGSATEGCRDTTVRIRVSLGCQWEKNSRLDRCWILNIECRWYHFTYFLILSSREYCACVR